MDQRTQYAAGKPFDTSTGNIKTINETIVFEDEVIFDNLTAGTPEADVLGIDAFGRAYRQPAGTGGGGDVIGGNISQDGGVVIYNGVSGKVIKNQTDVTITGAPGVYTLQNGKTRINTYDLAFFDPDTGRIGHNLGTVQNTEGERFGLCMGGSYDGLVIANQAICYVWIYEYGSLLLRRKINCVAGTVYDPLVDFEAVQTFGNFGMSADVPLRIDYDKVEASYDRILCLDGSNFMRERDLSINPWYNQDLNTTADVNFNNGTFNNIFSQAQTTNILLSTSPQITAFIPMRFKQLCEFQSNCDFTTAGTADFTGCTVLGLPASGDVSGPISSTDHTITRFNGIDGKTIQGSGVTLTDTNDMSGLNNLISQNLTLINISSDDAIEKLMVLEPITNVVKTRTATTLFNSSLGGESLVNSGTGPVLATKGIVPGTNISMSANATDVTISAPDVVVGPFASTDHNIVRYNGSSGKLVQDTGITVSDSNNMFGIGVLTAQNATLTGLTSNPSSDQVLVKNSLTNQIQIRDATTIGGDLSSDIISSTNRSICVFADTSGKLVTETALASITVGGNMFAQTIETSGATFNSSLQSVTVNNFQNSNTNFSNSTINGSGIIINNVVVDTTGTNRDFLTIDGDNLKKTTIQSLFGGIYIEGNLTITTISVINTWTLLGTIYSQVPVSAGVNFLTAQSVTVTATQSGNCNVTASLSLESQSATFIQYEFGIFKNGVEIDGSIRRSSTTDTNEDKNVDCSTMTSYTTNDIFDVRVRNLTNTTNVLITNGTLAISKIFE
jgi:hypothetical protein